MNILQTIPVSTETSSFVMTVPEFTSSLALSLADGFLLFFFGCIPEASEMVLKYWELSPTVELLLFLFDGLFLRLVGFITNDTSLSATGKL